MKTTAKRFEYFCWYIGGMAGLLTFGGIIIDAHRPPAHLWWALGISPLMTLAMHGVARGWGWAILFASPQPVPRPNKPDPRNKEYVGRRYIKNR